MFKKLKLLRNPVLLVGYPLFVITGIGFFIMLDFKDYIKEVLAFGILTSLFFVITLLIKQVKRQNICIKISYFILSLLAILKLSFYINYGVKISASAFYVIFETNAPEATDFFYQYLNYKIIGVIILFILPLFIVSKITHLNIFHSERKETFIKSKPLKYLCVIFMMGAIVLLHWKFKTENLIINSYYSYLDYKMTKANLKKNLAQTYSNFIEDVNSKDEEQTYIIIIGESTSALHMELYGYRRETNPLLSNIKDELIVFNNVITPHVHTITALDKILTQSDYENSYKEQNTSIVQLANEAGFSTYWISNQRPVGLHESIPTLIGSAAKHTLFLNTQNSNGSIFDETILPSLKNALKSKEKKKVIFLHLIGTHSAYSKRYPEAFNFFKEKNVLNKKLSGKESAIINEYDNAIRYNDFIVYSIIESAKAMDINGYVLYFSDHGDEVYDTMNLMGHNEYHGTQSMYEIPFLLWSSKKYAKYNGKLKNFKSYTNRKYVLEDFIHSFSDLSAIHFKGYDSTKSIFNRAFKEKPRLIRNGKNYDER